MTVKFKDPISAQACVMVCSSHLDYYDSVFHYLFRK